MRKGGQTEELSPNSHTQSTSTIPLSS